MNTCQVCGSEFAPRSKRDRTCTDCLKKRASQVKSVNISRDRLEAMEAALGQDGDLLVLKNLTIEKDLAEERAKVSRLRETITALKKTSESQAPAIPRDIRRLLIQLCHPDKHQGSQAATKATSWLLEGRV